MNYVYLLQSVSNSNQKYTGITENLEKRVNEHNSGKAGHTSKYRPWQIKVAVRFENDRRAGEFEKYLKSGSGRAFAKKHFW